MIFQGVCRFFKKKFPDFPWLFCALEGALMSFSFWLVNFWKLVIYSFFPDLSVIRFLTLKNLDCFWLLNLIWKIDHFWLPDLVDIRFTPFIDDSQRGKYLVRNGHFTRPFDFSTAFNILFLIWRLLKITNGIIYNFTRQKFSKTGTHVISHFSCIQRDHLGKSIHRYMTHKHIRVQMYYKYSFPPNYKAPFPPLTFW